ncbi:MAG: phosphatidate cytidylyltransferase [Planctomycetota bacterium]
MLKYRIPAAIFIGLVFYGCLWRDAATAGSMGLTLFIAVGTVVVMREYFRMVEAKGARPMVFFGVVMAVVLVFAHDRWAWEKWHGLPRSVPDLMDTVVALAVLGACALQGVRKSPSGAILNIGTTLLGFVYVWFLPSFLVKIRHLGVPGANGWAIDGAELVFVTIFVSKICDVGGLLVGKQFGRTKLSPVVSPNKTWEGFAGGIAFSVGLSLYMRWVAPGSALASLSVGTAALFGITMAVSGLLGDLLESAMKRDSEVKDSGGSVPGFGGLLDVVDSLMISAPTAYFFFLLAGARPALG